MNPTLLYSGEDYVVPEESHVWLTVNNFSVRISADKGGSCTISVYELGKEDEKCFSTTEWRS